MGKRTRNTPAGGSRNKGCRQKKSYPTRAAAEDGRKALIRRGQPPDRIRVYGTPGRGADQPCRWCGGWHVGHLIERKL